MNARDNIAAASLWMALGTVVSRLTGVARTLLIIWAVGTSLNADIFNTANTIPNALYILVAGGIFNVVLVPQLVRAMKLDEDGGDAYANRVITLGLLVLAVATIVLVLLVPLITRIVFISKFFEPGFEDQRHAAFLLTALCMPQVFFYGAFVLVGQVLNARGRFGPMMWAPILNNVVACAAIVAYMVVFGRSNASDGFSTNESLILGLGSTLGIAAQACILVPYLRNAGFRFRARFDFRGVGLGHTLRLGAWTLGFIVANQIAYFVIVRIGTGANVEAASTGGSGSGSTVYDLGFLISQMPHGIITVSLATAMMPTLSALAADRNFRRMRLELGRTLRIAFVIVAPLAVAVACFGQELATVAPISGGTPGHVADVGHTIQAFAPAMIAFTIHYLMLRGFYAAENTRTPFFVQTAIAIVNIAMAYFLVSLIGPSKVSTMLALAYGTAYLVGSALSATLLSRLIGPVFDAEMWRFLVRLALACAVTAGAMVATSYGIDYLFIDKSTKLGALMVGVVGGGVGGLAFLAAARAMRMSELSYLLDTLLRRRATRS